MKKVAIFGAAGLIGTYLTDYLHDKYEVCAITNKKDCSIKYDNVNYLNCSITNTDNFSNLPKNIDTVVMLAGLLPAGMSEYHPEEYFKVNTIGMLNVLEYCRKTNVKQIIYTQTHSDVKKLWGTTAIDAYSKPAIDYNNDHTVYTISKISAFELIKHYKEAYGINYAVFRCPNIYAWHPDTYYYLNGKKTVVAYRLFIKNAMNSLPIEIYGDGNSKRDVVYIKDLNQMIYKAIEKNIENGIYNVSNGVAISIEEQVKATIKVFSPSDKPSEIIYRPDKKVENLNYHYDISNAISDLDYCPKFFIEEMLLDMKKEIETNRLGFKE